MGKKYKLFLKQKVRQVIQRSDATFDEAMEYLKNTPFSLVEDEEGNQYTNKVELKNAKNFRPDDRTGSDNGTSSRREIFEDTDSKLSKVITDNSESSSERDNKWD